MMIPRPMASLIDLKPDLPAAMQAPKSRVALPSHWSLNVSHLAPGLPMMGSIALDDSMVVM